MPIPSAQPSLPLPLRRRRWPGPQSLTLMLVGAGALRMAPVGAQEPKRPAPVEIGEAERASQPDVAPVKIGEAGAAQGEPETAPVKIGESKEDKSKAKTAPVKVGEAAEGKQGKTPAPVKVGDSSGAKSDTAPVSIGEAAPANRSETAPVKVGEAPPAQSDSAPVTIGDASAANRVDVAPVTMKGEAMADAEFSTVAPSSLRVPMLFKQVGAGEAKIEALLQSGALKPDDLVWAVHHPRLWQEKAEVLTAAASTIEVYDAYLARFGEQVADAVSWEPSARAALAAELSRRGDERCVPLFETATAKWVAQWEREGQRKTEGAVPGLHALAWFYQGKGEKLKAAQIYEKSALYSTSPLWVGSALIEAARLYGDLGDADKAKSFYLQVAHNPDGLYASWAILEGFRQALKNNPEQAQNELLQLQKEVSNSDARLAAQFLLMWARYKAGDWTAFLQQSQQVLTQYENINEQSRRRTFAPLALQLENAQKWAKLWQKSTTVAENPDLDLKFEGPLQQPVERRVFVDTPTPTQLQVTVEGDADRVSARIEESPWASELAEIRHQQIVVVTIAPGEPQISAMLCIKSAANKGELLRLPVRVSANYTGEHNYAHRT